jgi:hypothetical protein
MSGTLHFLKFPRIDLGWTDAYFRAITIIDFAVAGMRPIRRKTTSRTPAPLMCIVLNGRVHAAGFLTWHGRRVPHIAIPLHGSWQ